MVDLSLGWLLNCSQARAKSFVHHPPERGVQLFSDSARPVKDIVINGKCCAHNGIIASTQMMSKHHYDSRRGRLVSDFGGNCFAKGYVVTNYSLITTHLPPSPCSGRSVSGRCVSRRRRYKLLISPVATALRWRGNR